MPYVISLSGWRLHSDRNFIIHSLNVRSQYYLAIGYEIFFRVGDAKGADAICLDWLAANFPTSFQVYQADWDQFGLKAGPLRNRDMLNGTLDAYSVSDLLIAFPQPGVYRYQDSGTWGCVKEAFRLGVEISIPSYRMDKSENSNKV